MSGTTPIELIGERTRRRVRPVLQLLGGAVSVLLMLSLATLTFLQVMNLIARRDELLTRLALGAGTSRLFQHVVVEAVVVALAGGLAGLALAAGGWQALRSLGPADISIPPGLGLISAGGGLLLALASSAGASAMAVGRFVRRWRVMDTSIGHRIGPDRSSRRLVSVLVVVQVSAAVGLAAMAVAMLSTVRQTLSVDRGFAPARAIAADISLPRYRYREARDRVRFFSQLLDHLRALPGIESAAAVNDAPFSTKPFSIFPITAAGDATGTPIGSIVKVATPGYFRTIGATLIRGRDLAETDTVNTPAVAVISESLATTLFGDAEALGKHLGVPGSQQPVGIVGVVRNIRESLEDSGTPTVYLPLVQRPRGAMMVLVQTERSSAETAAVITRAVRALDTEQPVARVERLDALVARAASRERLTTITVLVLALCALLIATAGLHAVTAMSLRSGLSEVGLRASLGATPVRLVRTFTWTGLRPMLIGMVAGTAVAVAMLALLRHVWPALGAPNVWLLAAVALAVVCVPVAGVILPVVRVARLSPAVTLREHQ